VRSGSLARLRVLYVGPYRPSPIAVRPWLFLRALQERHHIDLVTLAGGLPVSEIGAVARAYRPTAADRLAALRHLPDRAFPLQAMAVESLAMRRAVRTAIAQGGYDVVHVEHARALHLVPESDRSRVLFDAVDCLYDLFDQAAPYQGLARRALFRHEARRLERFEAEAIGVVPRVLVASRRDAAALLALVPAAPVSVLHNPVDLLRFRPRLDRSPNTVVFTGKMSFHANRVAARWLCDEIWPLVQVRHPHARLQIAGARPPAWLRRRNRSGVEVTGYVPDLGRLIAAAAVSVAPLRYAVGMQNKVLEAMACAIPVVTTTAAVGDLGFAEGGHGFVANDAQAFAERICWVLEDRRLAGEMGRAARDYVERHHAVGPLADQLDRYYHDLCRALKPETEKSEVQAS
jgi:glycosyltransferase involved in cell wall biosynthesis